MNKYLYFFLPVLLVLVSSVSYGQQTDYKNNYNPAEFAGLIRENPSFPVIDVRTPGEFSKGHLQNAVNFDWNGKNFEKQLASVNKEEPVLVYCLSGGRSSSAAASMRAMGFSRVYELEGGIMKWRAAGLPETAAAADIPEGMSMDRYNELVKQDKKVLVDFYADWCVPCKKMKPYLEEISRDMADEVVVLRINVDENRSLCQQLKIDEIPVLRIYQKGKMTWNNTGFIEKKEVVARLK